MQELHVVHRDFSRGVAAGLSLVLIGLAGCTSGNAPAAPVEPATAASRAIELCDKDADAALTLVECGAAQGLQSVFATYDSDGDGKLIAAEIEQGIQNWSDRPYPVPVEVQVVNGRRAIRNATVKLEPVAFLAENLPVAEGVTDERGIARMHATEFPFPESLQRERFMFVGLYNVKVTVPNQGKPIPVLGTAIDNSSIASRALRIEVSGNGTAKVRTNQ